MGERPIIFNDAMVRAILDGRKTVTRRPVKSNCGPPLTLVHRKQGPSGRHWAEPGGWVRPLAAVGDVLYVREAWGLHAHHDFTYWCRASIRGRTEDDLRGSYEVAYAADARSPYDHWRPSIHMPRWAARIFLRVTSVRVERVQDITDEQARAEGVYPICGGYMADVDSEWRTTAREAFRDLWDGRSKPCARWADNPWAWVIEFERIEDYRGEVSRG